MIETKDTRGTLFENDRALFFFGNKLSLLDSLKDKFPNYRFHRIQQVHGDKCVEITEHSTDKKDVADGHWTKLEKVALCISTADCIPCLIYCDSTKRIAGIHAGWKGVANQIISKSLGYLVDSGSDISSISIVCGPHILMNSFEVETPVRNQILQTLSPIDREKCVKDMPSSQKSFIDLSKVVDFQLRDLGVQASQITWLDADTMTNTNYHSFRRDKNNSGRNLSFVVLK